MGGKKVTADLNMARLIQATRTFGDITRARDDLGALDSLQGNINAAKKAGMFNGLFEVARFLCDRDLMVALDSGTADAALASAGLDRQAVVMARSHAQRFLGVSPNTCYKPESTDRQNLG